MLARLGLPAGLLCTLLAAGCTVSPPSEAAADPATPMPAAKPAAEENEKEVKETDAKPSQSKASAEDKAKAAKLAKEGTTVMTDASKTPKEKYPAALELYRKALALDPDNEEAKSSKAMIESIYKSMGKPVPGAL